MSSLYEFIIQNAIPTNIKPSWIPLNLFIKKVRDLKYLIDNRDFSPVMRLLFKSGINSF